MAKGNGQAFWGYLMQLVGKKEQAYWHYSKAFEKGTDHISALGGYGQLLVAKGEFPLARQVYRRILSLPQKKIRKALQYGYASRINIILTTWKCGELEHALSLAEVLAEQNRTAMTLGIVGMLQIEKSKLSGDFSKTISYCEETLQYDPEDGVLLDNLGQALLFGGNLKRAEKYLRKALDKAPEQTDSMGALARCLCLLGQFDEAQSWNEKAVQRPNAPYRTITNDFLNETAKMIAQKTT